MDRKLLTRGLILLAVLVIFAGAAWYFLGDSGKPHADAVLAALETEILPGEENSYIPASALRPDSGLEIEVLPGKENSCIPASALRPESEDGYFVRGGSLL